VSGAAVGMEGDMVVVGGVGGRRDRGEARRERGKENKGRSRAGEQRGKGEMGKEAEMGGEGAVGEEEEGELTGRRARAPR